LAFFEFSTCGNAKIENRGGISFQDYSSSGSAAIHTLDGGNTDFILFANGGNAQFDTEAGGTVDFSQSAGLTGDHHLTAGSIDGAGTYLLGADQLTGGLKGISTNVSGLIDGFGGSLVIHAGSLTLSHVGNTYTGGTTIEQGTLDLAAIEAAGTGDIAFHSAGKKLKVLKIENVALLGNVFTNDIVSFGRHDVLDLTGLKCHAGATATYHKASQRLTVHSGHTDTLTLFGPHGTHFTAANDGHGGTKVTLDPPPATAAAASLSSHHFAEQHWATDVGGSAGHPGDFLFTA
jgi:autotransporter-associated beta strand protein